MRNLGWVLCWIMAFGVSSLADSNDGSVEIEAFPQSLDIQTALTMLNKQNPDVQIANLAVVQSMGDARGAKGTMSLPTLSFAYGRTFTYDSSKCQGCSNNAYNIGIADTAALIDLMSGRRGLRMDQADQGVKAREQSKADLLRVVRTSLKSQVTHIAIAQKKVAFCKDALDRLEQIRTRMSKRKLRTASQKSDFLRVDVDYQTAQQLSEEAEEELKTTKVGLAQLLGISQPTGHFTVTEPVEDLPDSTFLLETSEELLVEKALEKRPDLKMVQNQVVQSKIGAQLADRQWVPDFAFNINYAQQGIGQFAITPPTLFIGIAAPIPMIDQIQGSVQRARAEVTTQKWIEQRTRAQIAFEVGARWTTYRFALSRLNRMQDGLLGSANQAFTTVQRQYNRSRASLLDMLDAQRTYVSAQMDYFQDLDAFWDSFFALEEALGVDLRDAG